MTNAFSEKDLAGVLDIWGKMPPLSLAEGCLYALTGRHFWLRGARAPATGERRSWAEAQALAVRQLGVQRSCWGHGTDHICIVGYQVTGNQATEWREKTRSPFRLL